MQKILLLSDTHGYIDDTILKYVKQADQVWHAGDIGSLEVTDAIKAIKPLKAVYGNIDNATIRREFPEEIRFTCQGVDVWMIHIGGYPNRYSPQVKERIKKNPPKLFICGHSHILKVKWDKGLNLLHLNPGAVGQYGIHQVRTMLRFVLEKGEIKKLEIIEIKKGS
ncbi:metallophosphoesterase family protein [Galbibacter sp.]|uniref:metallophosphoesterase family protein n=1 Tax=Galbibacter sp. TaxID=2918471 RepID=UPI002B72BC37|nr:metallophosphoesterase family protein [Galbibacter sp.]HLV62242.1 metallophosphoesterase family protein [Galbibacter sp.]